jgi:hypothetical protein
MRRWLRVPIAVPIALVVVLSCPLTAEASVGVGIQAGPVRLQGVAHPGESYALPPVYVANTGNQAESIRVQAEQLFREPVLAVPASWVQAGPGVQLQPGQGARIPVELVVPDGAKPGAYLGYLVALGSAGIVVGQANFSAAAATRLEFSVKPGPAPGMSLSLPPWTWWAMGGLLLLAAAVFGVRRSGLRIRVERKTANSGVAWPGGPRG